MRGYSVAAATLALGLDAKWLDNLLSQHRVAGVSQARQGVQRRLTPESLWVIATVGQLCRDMQIPVARALRLAHDLWRQPGDGSDDDVAVEIFGEINLLISRAKVRAQVSASLPEALEMAPRPRRGRPRRSPRP